MSPVYERLQLLGMGHYVWGVLQILVGVGILVAVLAVPGPPQTLDQMRYEMTSGMLPPGAVSGSPPPERTEAQRHFAIFQTFGCCISSLNVVLGIANIVSGFMIRWAQGRGFSLVVAGINLLSVPIGTVLGVFCFILLTSEQARRQYGDSPSPTVPD